MHRSKNICQHELAAIREDAALPEVALGRRSAPCPTAVGSIRPLISKLPRREWYPNALSRRGHRAMGHSAT